MINVNSRIPYSAIVAVPKPGEPGSRINPIPLKHSFDIMNMKSVSCTIDNDPVEIFFCPETKSFYTYTWYDKALSFITNS